MRGSASQPTRPRSFRSGILLWDVGGRAACGSRVTLRPGARIRLGDQEIAVCPRALRGRGRTHARGPPPQRIRAQAARGRGGRAPVGPQGHRLRAVPAPVERRRRTRAAAGRIAFGGGAHARRGGAPRTARSGAARRVAGGTRCSPDSVRHPAATAPPESLDPLGRCGDVLLAAVRRRWPAAAHAAGARRPGRAGGHGPRGVRGPDRAALRDAVRRGQQGRARRRRVRARPARASRRSTNPRTAS